MAIKLSKPAVRYTVTWSMAATDGTMLRKVEVYESWEVLEALIREHESDLPAGAHATIGVECDPMGFVVPPKV